MVGPGGLDLVQLVVWGSVYCAVKVVCRQAGIEATLAVRGITRFKSDLANMGTVDTSLSHALIRYRSLK